MTKPQYFLIQVEEFGSNHILNKSYYQHVGWERTKKDKDHGLVKPGDYVFVYFTSKAINFKMKLKRIYKVEKITKNHNRFYLKLWKELNGIHRNEVKKWILKGKLSNNIKKCTGGQGFNIIRILKPDFNFILKLDNQSQIHKNKSKNQYIKKIISKSENIEITEDEMISREVEKKIVESKTKNEIEKEIFELNKKIKKMKHKTSIIQTKERFRRLKKMYQLLKQKYIQCMICKQPHFEMENGKLYSEVAHIIPFSKNQKDNMENLMVLCPTCHKKFDNGKYLIREKMYKILTKNYPKIKFEKFNIL